jgi:uncharacterized protein YciI
VAERRLLVRWAAGPTWSDGRSPREQPGWEEHASYIDDLVARGIMVMGGPLTDHTGSMTLLEGISAAEARELLLADPFVANGVFVLDEILDWTIYVDELTPPD